MPTHRSHIHKKRGLTNFLQKNTRSVSTKQSVPSSGGKRPWAKDCNCEALSICWEVRWGLSLSSLDFRRVQGTQPAFNCWKSDMRASRDTVRYKEDNPIHVGAASAESNLWEIEWSMWLIVWRIQQKILIVEYLTVVKYWNDMKWQHNIMFIDFRSKSIFLNMPHEVVHTSTFHFPSRFRSECIQAAMQTSLCSTFLGTKHFLHKLHYNHLYEPHDSCGCMLSTIVLAAGRFNVQNSTGAAEQQKILHTDPASAFRIEQGQCFFPGLRWLQHPNVSFQGALTSTEGWCCTMTMVLGMLKCFSSSAGNTIRTKMSSPKPWLFDRSFKNMCFFTTIQLHFCWISALTSTNPKQTDQTKEPTSTVDSDRFQVRIPTSTPTTLVNGWLYLRDTNLFIVQKGLIAKECPCLSLFIYIMDQKMEFSGGTCDFGMVKKLSGVAWYGWRKAIWVELKANTQFICLQM